MPPQGSLADQDQGKKNLDGKNDSSKIKCHAEDAEDEMEEDNNAETQCGVGSCRPSCLQTCARMEYFTATLSLMNIFGNMNYSYYSAVITQIEKCFGLSSSMTGFIKNVDNIGYITCVLFVSHLCRYANKPRLFSGATIVTAVAIFIFAIPHFIYGGGSFSSALVSVDLNRTQKIGKRYEFCDGVDWSEDQCSSGGNKNLAAINVGALAFFILSEFLQGVAQSPKFTLSLTYMDDNAKKNSPKHMGIMFGSRAFAPILGFSMGAWATSIYVDLSDPGLDKRDPRWVGAWWIGFVICAVVTLITAIPLVFFPAHMKSTRPVLSHKKPHKQEPGNFKNKIKDLPAAILRLVRNPVLMLLILGACFSSQLQGFGTFTPKYLELQFHVTASQASLITGVITMVSWAVAPMIAGQIVARMNMSLATKLRFIIICTIVGCLGFAVLMFIGCPNSEWAGTINLERQNITMECNSDCECDPTAYIPVCGSDGLNYFSPCMAGCQDWVNIGNDTDKLFTGCRCIEGGNGTATAGKCIPKCNMLIPYLVIKSLASFVASMGFVPIMTSLMKVVEDRDKALSLAFTGGILQVASFPAPILFGLVIDSSCMVTQMSCDRKGACLLYDAHDVRYKIHAFAAGLKLVSGLCYILCWNKARGLRETPPPITASLDVKDPEQEKMLSDYKESKESNV